MTRAESEFYRYTEPYRQYGEKILLKTEHTLRVRDLCAGIAGSLGLSREETELAAVCGLFHDIGRFEQWRRYGTYNDLRSVDHGNLGAEVIGSGHLLTTLPEADRGAVLAAAEYHNKYRVPDTLGGRDRLFVEITRDADKIDVLELYVKGGHATKTENRPMSDPVFRALLGHRPIRKEETERRDDEIAIRLGFAFDLNFRRSFEIVRENRCFSRLIDLQLERVTDPALIRQLEELKGSIVAYLAEKAEGR